jgi:hypothetical protein
MRRPKVVALRRKVIPTATASQRKRSAGMPSTLLRTTSCTAFGAYEAHEPQVSPFETPSVRPSMMPFIPRVITTAGTAR